MLLFVLLVRGGRAPPDRDLHVLDRGRREVRHRLHRLHRKLRVRHHPHEVSHG